MSFHTAVRVLAAKVSTHRIIKLKVLKCGGRFHFLDNLHRKEWLSMITSQEGT